MLGQVTSDRTGQWVLVVDQPLPSGSQELTLRARSPGGTSLNSEQGVVLLVPDCGLPQSQRGAAVAILTPKGDLKDGNVSKVLQLPKSPAATERNGDAKPAKKAQCRHRRL